MNPVTLPITGLQHIGIPVSDIRKSVTFYEMLGFKNVMESTFVHHKGQGTCIMMQLENIVIELYQLPDHELPAIKARKDGHIDHIALDVSNIDETFSILTQAGYTIIEQEPIFLHFWKNGCRFFNILGPDGERIEFNQVL